MFSPESNGPVNEVKRKVVKQNLIKSDLSSLLVGSIAATIAYWIGLMLGEFVS